MSNDATNSSNIVYDEVLGMEVEVQRFITPEVGEYHPHDDIPPQIPIGEALKEIREGQHE